MRDDLVPLLHMRDVAQYAIGFTGGRCRADLDSDRLLAYGLVKAIELIGEVANQVSKETQLANPGIPWRDIIAMRHPGYVDINYDVIWSTATERLPELVAWLAGLIGAYQSTKEGNQATPEPGAAIDHPPKSEGLSKELQERYGLGKYGPVLIDNGCGEPTAWGHVLGRKLPEREFNELSRYGHLEYGSPGKLNGSWVLVTKRLTKPEAVARYGPITHEERGPRGGFRYDVYGNKMFFSRLPE